MFVLSNHTTKKELQHAVGFDTSNLAARKQFFAFKAEVSKPDIYELLIVPTGLNNLKTKADDLDVSESSTVRFEKIKICSE